MRALLLMTLLSTFAFSQEYLQCDFDILDNNSDVKELEESKLSFLWQLNDTEVKKKEVSLYKVRLYPGTKKMYEHQVLAFDINANGSFKKTLDDKGIPYDLKLVDKLVIDVNRIYLDMHVNIRTSFNYWKFSMGGEFTQKITNDFNSLTPLYAEVYYEKIKKKLFGKDKTITERTMVPIYFSCQKLDTDYVIQTDLSEKKNTIFSPIDEKSGAVRN